MSLIRRPAYFRCGCLEVFAEDWRRVAGESLAQTEKSNQGDFTTFQLWMPGLHLTVSRRCPVAVAA